MNKRTTKALEKSKQKEMDCKSKQSVTEFQGDTLIRLDCINRTGVQSANKQCFTTNESSPFIKGKSRENSKTYKLQHPYMSQTKLTINQRLSSVVEEMEMEKSQESSPTRQNFKHFDSHMHSFQSNSSKSVRIDEKSMT